MGSFRSISPKNDTHALATSFFVFSLSPLDRRLSLNHRLLMAEFLFMEHRLWASFLPQWQASD